MNIVDSLRIALINKDWDIVLDVYDSIGGKVSDLEPVETKPPKRASRVKPLLDKLAEPKKRGRPKKVKPGDMVVAGNQVARVLPANTNEFDQFKVVNNTPSTNDDRRPAKAEPFQTPRGPNKFNPKIEVAEDGLYGKINDNVKPVPRVRQPSETKVPVFCQDCQQTIQVHPMFKKDPYFCEFPKLKRKCPYVK